VVLAVEGTDISEPGIGVIDVIHKITEVSACFSREGPHLFSKAILRVNVVILQFLLEALVAIT
jgi:hypothetical protein